MKARATESEAGGSRQDANAQALNATFFAGNTEYKQSQHRLELYRLIGLAAAHETAHSRALLDIGNGGLFVYPIEHIPRVVAIDVFVEDDFAARYPSVDWLQVSALEMEFREPFDTIITINTLHHVIGSSITDTYANLHELMRRTRACLQPDGKFVIIESTMPRWFIRLHRAIFPLVLALWPLSHPPTFQFHFRDIVAAAEASGFELRELTFIPKTSDFMFLGRQVKSWMAPIRVGKFVFALPKVGGRQYNVRQTVTAHEAG